MVPSGSVGTRREVPGPAACAWVGGWVGASRYPFLFVGAPVVSVPPGGRRLRRPGLLYLGFFPCPRGFLTPLLLGAWTTPTAKGDDERDDVDRDP